MPLILLVEDDPDSREIYRIVLRAEGFAVVAVQDGLAALRFLETKTPALIVLDLGLPGLSGYDVAMELRHRVDLGRIPIVVVTGFDPSPLEPHVECILRKPVEPERVAEAVRSCLSRVHRSAGA